MQIKGASERTVRAAKTLEEIKLKAQNSMGNKMTSPIDSKSPPKMLATPRNSITSIQRDDDVDVDELLAEGKAAAETATETEIKATSPYTISAPQQDDIRVEPSIESGRYSVDDIDDWLIMTKFYDDGYRQKTLARHRRLKAIEEERKQLLQEEQEDLQRNRMLPAKLSSILPETLLAADMSKEQRSSYSPPPANGKYWAESTLPEPAKDNQKRSRDEVSGEYSDRPPKKIIRRQSLERFQIGPEKHIPPRDPAIKYEWPRPEELRSRGNDISRRFTRPDLFDGYNAPGKSRQIPSIRYFHIRSWNHGNVRVAQRSCTWVTQKANEHTFIKAFEQSRRVILFFSVNKSRAFQGIAEMGSIPGAAGLLNPAWRAQLQWPATDAFALIWLLKQEIPHDSVRHLINSYNENLPAHVGRDGVEIEPRVGEQMYDTLHDFARRGGGYR